MQTTSKHSGFQSFNSQIERSFKEKFENVFFKISFRCFAFFLQNLYKFDKITNRLNKYLKNSRRIFKTFKFERTKKLQSKDEKLSEDQSDKSLRI